MTHYSARMQKLHELFSNQLVHWKLGDSDRDVREIVDDLLRNVDPGTTWGEHGRSKAAARIEQEHRKVLLKHFNIPEEQARALANALILWQVIAAAREAPHLEDAEVPLFDAQGLNATRRHRILFVFSEWFPNNGGIATFNAGLASALATSQRIACYLPSASEGELDSASAAGVTLITSNPSKYLTGLPAQLLVDIPNSLKELDPEVIVGHDRRSGGCAIELKRRHFPNARVCVIVHTAPHAIERHKTDRKTWDEIAIETEARTNDLVSMVDNSDIAFAVGPRLRRQTSLVVGERRVINLLTPGANILEKPGASGKQRFILLFGRAEDSSLKGVELAHEVARILLAKRPHVYEWKVRGVPPGDLAHFIRRYRHFSLAQHYSANRNVIEETIAGSALIVMPSLEEGFGLTALEAIGHNRPVLISAESGVAEYLESTCPDDAAHFIVSTQDLSSEPRDENVASNWANAIERVFANWETTMAKLERIRNILHNRGTWESAKNEFLGACFPIPT